MKMRRSLSVKMSLSDGSGFEDKVKEAKQKWSACAEKRRRVDILDKGCCNMVGGKSEKSCAEGWCDGQLIDCVIPRGSS